MPDPSSRRRNNEENPHRRTRRSRRGGKTRQIFVVFCANPVCTIHRTDFDAVGGHPPLTIRNRSPPVSLQDAFNWGAIPGFRPADATRPRGRNPGLSSVATSWQDPSKTRGEQTAINFETLFWTPVLAYHVPNGTACSSSQGLLPKTFEVTLEHLESPGLGGDRQDKLPPLEFQNFRNIKSLELRFCRVRVRARALDADL
jgi:hypothetical protein